MPMQAMGYCPWVWRLRCLRGGGVAWAVEGSGKSVLCPADIRPSTPNTHMHMTLPLCFWLGLGPIIRHWTSSSLSMQSWKASSKSRASAFEFFAGSRPVFLCLKRLLEIPKFWSCIFTRQEERVEEAPSGLIYFVFCSNSWHLEKAWRSY